MAKVHYIVETKKKALIQEEENGHIKIIIDCAKRIEENGQIKVKNGKIIKNSSKKNKKMPFIYRIKCIIYVLIIVALVGYIILGEVSKNSNKLENNMFDTIMAIIGLLSTLNSIPAIDEFRNKLFGGIDKVKDLWSIIMMLCIPFYIIWVIEKIGVLCNLGNICGILSFIISIGTVIGIIIKKC